MPRRTHHPPTRVAAEPVRGEPGEQDWYGRHRCDHAHCPRECEHPQPFMLADGRLVCGLCAIIGGELIEMVPCTPEVCS